ncbi:transcriptional regulation of mitochondrial recombination-domain-containing protein [Xylaria telfairii]|nr:transcriptional regulation of mitochondrial recombination-domain-containing protein [Xylaria telfairii]
MAMRVSPITAQLGKLSIGGGGATSRTSIRLAHTAKRRKAERIEPSFEPGHGEKIFVFNHFVDGFTVYSHKSVLKANHAFRQIPFNGKKLRPAKLRKDYWRPMAMIQFPEGHGEAGRSVFQRLRECKKLHEYSWGDDVLYGESGRTLTTRERGRRLNNQRANTIADMAAVLGGLGKGNKIVVGDAAAVEGEAPVAVDEGKTLLQATVWWVDAVDKNYASKWTKNVTHELFDEATLEPLQRTEDELTSEPAESVTEPGPEPTKRAEQSQGL